MTSLKPALSVAMAASFAVHAAALVASGGHGPRVDGAGRWVPLEVELSPEAPALVPRQEVRPSDPVAREGLKGPEVRAHAHLRHTHSYPVQPGHDEREHDPALVHALTATTELAGEDSAQPPEAAPRFALQGSTSSSALHGVSTTATRATPGSVTERVAISPVSAPARLLVRAPVQYPWAAREAELEADVPVELLVDERGAVVDVQALGQFDFGLAEAALLAARNYRFAPALRGGRPVRTRVKLLVQFRLQ